jgi:hypothetical protein
MADEDMLLTEEDKELMEMSGNDVNCKNAGYTSSLHYQINQALKNP